MVVPTHASLFESQDDMEEEDDEDIVGNKNVNKNVPMGGTCVVCGTPVEESIPVCDGCECIHHPQCVPADVMTCFLPEKDEICHWCKRPLLGGVGILGGTWTKPDDKGDVEFDFDYEDIGQTTPKRPSGSKNVTNIGQTTPKRPSTPLPAPKSKKAKDSSVPRDPFDESCSSTF